MVSLDFGSLMSQPVIVSRNRGGPTQCPSPFLPVSPLNTLSPGRVPLHRDKLRAMGLVVSA